MLNLKLRTARGEVGGSAEGTPFGPLEDANGRSAERSARDREEAGRHAVSKVSLVIW